MKVFLKEDHDEVLKVWRKSGVRNLDLVHVDAHIDFVVHPARSPQEILEQAVSLKQLKKNLEYTLAFLAYEKNLDKQTDIGNYIYPAMRDGMVKNFWWVIPGDVHSFAKNFKLIKKIFKNSFLGQKTKLVKKGQGRAVYYAGAREFWVCVLDALPVFSQPVLLDIDCDFLVVKDLSRADNICDIGEREICITPGDLKDKLSLKVKKTVVTTIVYSTRGGYTPMVYRYLGDELAYGFNERRFYKRFQRADPASASFQKFLTSRRKSDYRQAVRLEPAYRSEDNNYGPLYLLDKRFKKAQKEFVGILKVDKANPAALMNMGAICLRRREYSRALNLFTKSWREGKRDKALRPAIVFRLAQVNFKLRRFNEAQKLFLSHKRLAPLSGATYYFLAKIHEIKKEYHRAAGFYRDSLRLGLEGIEILRSLLRLSLRLGIEEKKDIIKHIKQRLACVDKPNKQVNRLMKEVMFYERQRYS